MKPTAIKPLLAATSLLALLAACADGQRGVLTGSAGDFLDEGYFASPTAHNVGVQNGEINHTIALARRFADEVSDTVNFEFNSAQLDASARTILSQQAGWIAQFPEVRFRVYGHTDLVGSNTYNKRLGLRRANAVVNYLVSQGISRSRLEAVASFGETQPLIVTEGRELRNRRTVTEVSGFVSRHPTVMNGKYAAVIFREYVESAKPQPQLTKAGLDGSVQ
ncbi:OmpA family protein [Aliiroseovarius sp. KMU-50]|uniref:OmpA family protein n=1 Tax=Aliiroseovarius salicola TaxID=3009082 RepID=A0ABT4W0S8_9RHOB|nr:OmpA family protein [Aliiroseovarius sp. KMU-50]MDA5094024.1 OmpA family protein [Aliiroseovarius sp. KMU-50]